MTKYEQPIIVIEDLVENVLLESDPYDFDKTWESAGETFK